MRWKLLIGFGSAFTLVFAVISIWVYQYTSSTAFDRLSSQLRSATVGGSNGVDAELFTKLLATVPAVPDASNPTGLGWPTSPLYEESASQIARIQQVSPEAFPYTYFRDPADGELYYATSSGFFLEPHDGAPYRAPVRPLVSADSYDYMLRGLVDTTEEPIASDAYGDWLSDYTPIRDEAGKVVGALGVDYSIAYLDEVQNGVRREILPVLAGAYLVLLALVVYVSSTLVRPLRRLTAGAQRVSEGEYDVEVTSLTETRFPDEMTELAAAFQVMAGKVAERERSLKQEVQRLRVEIDHARRDASVREIVESDFFTDLTAKAAEMRRRARGQDSDS